MLAPTLVVIAIGANLNPLCVIMPMFIWAQITYLLPAVDVLYLIIYSKSYYTIPDVLKFGLPLTIVLIIVYTGLLIPLVDLAMMI